MKSLEQQKKELEQILDKFDNVIMPSLSEADKAVGKYGFGSYLEVCTAMSLMAKRAVALAKSIKESSGMTEVVGGVDVNEIINEMEPYVETTLPGIQNSLIDTFSAEDIDEADSDDYIKTLMKFVTV